MYARFLESRYNFMVIYIPYLYPLENHLNLLHFKNFIHFFEYLVELERRYIKT